MADVTGPISSLPGSLHKVPEGMMCDEHEDRPAVKRVQGETDSFGSEMMDMCQECFDAYEKACDEPQEPYPCDWCKVESDRLLPTRDIDEGSSGPVYQVCPACRQKQIKDAMDELESYGDDY